MGQTGIGIFSDKNLTLDGVLATPDGILARIPALLVCHPHPTLGGDMEHPVVTAICRAASDAGLASLRFNFRGVGESEGTFTNGDKEKDDLRAALVMLQHLPGINAKKIGLVGYSFGASVILGAIPHLKSAQGFVLVSPPVSSVRRSRIGKDKRPKLFMVGGRDRVVPSVDLQKVLDEVRPPVQFVEIPDSDHRLAGLENDVADRVVTFMLETL